ncbi:MAG: hypothetical protein QF714_06295, partial [Dehalococcoidia bacterium]|nr:hypothetical protein [Dehalococcoidia bacterium]
CVSNPEPIVAWIDAFIRELHAVRQLLDSEGGPNNDEVHQVFEKAFVARSMWQSGALNPQVRRAGSHSDIPSFAETMGDMFVGRLGRRGMEAQKKLFKETDGFGRKKK